MSRAARGSSCQAADYRASSVPSTVRRLIPSGSASRQTCPLPLAKMTSPLWGLRRMALTHTVYRLVVKGAANLPLPVCSDMPLVPDARVRVYSCSDSVQPHTPAGSVSPLSIQLSVRRFAMSDPPGLCGAVQRALRGS